MLRMETLNDTLAHSRVQFAGKVMSGFALALILYMGLVFAHGIEHIAQVTQAFVLGWPRMMSMGIVGHYFPELISMETLHFIYNGLQWLGLVLLLSEFQGRARTWWKVAIVLQSWHFFEHILLEAQYLSGYYLFGASHQISIGQLWIPRIELHFIYVSLVTVPTLMGVYHYVKQARSLEPTTD